MSQQCYEVIESARGHTWCTCYTRSVNNSILSKYPVIIINIKIILLQFRGLSDDNFPGTNEMLMFSNITNKFCLAILTGLLSVPTEIDNICS